MLQNKTNLYFYYLEILGVVINITLCILHFNFKFDKPGTTKPELNKIAWSKTSKEWKSLSDGLKTRLEILIDDDGEFWLVYILIYFLIYYLRFFRTFIRVQSTLIVLKLFTNLL